MESKTIGEIYKPDMITLNPAEIKELRANGTTEQYATSCDDRMRINSKSVGMLN
ncbi:unnamed protein product [Nesidiocoris tenuis]|uniref:Uncharacterized protein n=1 Tax=Nesidiocoris tenuis TaxID=355587 RepID=A0A6H5G9L0_9HEMI|nr:unnamed protein product [Nesidiocoris tenuis]